MTVRRFLSFVALAFLWTGSQIPVYLFGTILDDVPLCNSCSLNRSGAVRRYTAIYL